MAVVPETVIKIIVEWLERHGEIPRVLQAKLDVLRNQVEYTDKAVAQSARTLAEYVMRQKLLADSTKGLVPSFKNFGEKATDVSTIQMELAKRLNLTYGIVDKATRRALPDIGVELDKLAQKFTSVKQRAGTAAAGIGIISDYLAEHIEGYSAPKISQALSDIAERYGTTKEDIVKSFYVAAV
ncbi:MAG: hypothetical protein DRN81_02655, partial [Thermoproteota archaeon]